MDRAGTMLRTGLILLFSFGLMVFEYLGEQAGLLAHASQWRHWYTFFGGIVYWRMIWNFYKWMVKQLGENR
ncbi:MAG: hypothetical protein H0Z32_15540 [Bacillaceae bacterium]|nr:hypothetical protein [Bacillaceae bacterium]